MSPAQGLPAGQERPRSEEEYITQQLGGNDKQVQAGLDRIKLLTDAGVKVSGNWVSVLADRGLYAEAEALSVKGMLNAPEDGSICLFARTRVNALLQQGKYDEAVSAAKAYYNLAQMNESEGAVTLVAQCLDAASPDDSTLPRRFKTQQIEWSAATTKPSAELGENVLKSIKVNPEPFASAAADTRRDFLGLMSKGNLLLLADRAAEARKAFESAELQATQPQDSSAAVEGIARAIRAQAGALGPANAFILARQKSP